LEEDNYKKVKKKGNGQRRLVFFTGGN
jgi:hypothetical protein